MKSSNIKDSGICLYSEVDAIAVGRISKKYSDITVPKVSINIYKHAPNEQILSDSFSEASEEVVVTIRIAALELDISQAKGLLEGLQNSLSSLEDEK